MSNIAIWGVGPTGKKIYERIRTLHKVICFIDNDQGIFGGIYSGIEIVAPEQSYEMIRKGVIDKIVLGTSANNYDDVLLQINDNLHMFNKIYYVKEIGHSNELIRYAENDLGYIEFDATRKCNLNCRGCLRYSNITRDNEGYHLDALQRDLQQLKKIFNNIAFIKILGGEPLLRVDLHKFLELIFKYFPDTQVDILSNGILASKMDRLLIDEIKKHAVRLSISIYKDTEKYTEEITSFCNSEGIECSVYVNKEKFLKQLNLRGDSDGEEIVKNCMSKKCTIIKDGIINRCCQPTFTYELNKKFGTKFPENIGINIYEEGITYKGIKEYIRNNTQFCRYCTTPEEYTWSCGKNGILLSDWVVK